MTKRLEVHYTHGCSCGKSLHWSTASVIPARNDLHNRTTPPEENKSETMKILRHPTIPRLTNYRVLMETWLTAELIARKGLARVPLTPRDSALPGAPGDTLAEQVICRKDPFGIKSPEEMGIVIIREIMIRHNSHCCGRIRTRRAMKTRQGLWLAGAGARRAGTRHRTTVPQTPRG